MTHVHKSRRKLLTAAAITAVASPLLIAAVHEIKARMGTHGMVLFGGAEGLYASHMPMFHTPHDVQVILRLRVEDDGIEQSIRPQLATKPALWSIEPEKFDLSRLHKDHKEPLNSFQAKVYEGHFERGGKVRFERVRFRVESTVLFNQLDPTKRASLSPQFLLAGKGREQFLIKHLDQRPDVDLIGQFINETSLASNKSLSIKLDSLAPPSSTAVNEALRAAGANPKGNVTWVYVETSDLV
jgi:hypothetical protein